jgi:hypothetical protein
VGDRPRVASGPLGQPPVADYEEGVPVAPKREPAGPPMAGAKVVDVDATDDAWALGEPVGPKREPAGPPMAGAKVVVVVAAGDGAGVTAGEVVGGGVVVGDVEVDAVTEAVAGCIGAVVAVESWWEGFGAVDPPFKAATVPPTAPRTATMATPATTIRCLMDGMLRLTYQPRAKSEATSGVAPGTISVHSSPRAPGGSHTQGEHVDLEEIEAIRQLKYRYFRLLDTKRFIELGQLLTDDATSAYQSGEHSYEGRDAIVAFLEESLGNADIVTMHNGHHPEIELTGPTSATGVWYLEDRVVVRAMDYEIVGTLLYDDRYVKIDGEWKIKHTGYERIFEEHRRHSDQKLHSFRAMFDTDAP